MENYDINIEEGMYANKSIPEKKRRGWIGIAAIYFGMTASLSAFAAGGALISGLNLAQSILAIAIATLALVLLFFIPIGYIGAREGLNTYLIGEAAFGTKGSNVITAFVVTIIPCVGWYGVQVAIASDALTEVFGGNSNLTPWIMIILGIVFALPAMYGVVSMAWLDYIAVPAIIIITIYGFTKAMNIVGSDGLFNFQPTSSESIVWGVNIIIASLIVGVTFTADYTRWNKNKLGSVSLSGSIGIAPALFILSIIAAMMGITAVSLGGVDEPWNVAQVLKAIGLPSASLILVIIMQWTTNITSAYSSGLALTKVFGWSRFWWTLIAALVGTLLSLMGIMNYFIVFLGVLAAFVSPAAGVLISEYYFVSKMKLVLKEGLYWPGLISWFIGGAAALYIPFFIPAINGAIIAGLIYYLINKFKKKNER